MEISLSLNEGSAEELRSLINSVSSVEGRPLRLEDVERLILDIFHKGTDAAWDEISQIEEKLDDFGGIGDVVLFTTFFGDEIIISAC